MDACCSKYFYVMPLKQVIESHVAAGVVGYRRYVAEKSLQIFSSPRGGSTWLMSMLSQLPGVVGVWEPLHQTRGVVPRSWGHRPHRDSMLKPDEDIFNEVLAGNRVNVWTMSRTRLNEARTSSQLLIKYVRANNLLPWILRRWKLRHKPIFLMRHPWDTVTSHVRAFGGISPEQDVLKDFPGHSELHLRWPMIREVSDARIRQLHVWCVLNAPIWQQYSNSSEVIPLHYHDLVLNPEQCMVNLIQRLDWNHPTNSDWRPYDFVRTLDPLQRSNTDFKGDLIRTPAKQLWKNLEALSAECKEEVQVVFEEYGITQYSMEDIRPLE